MKSGHLLTEFEKDARAVRLIEWLPGAAQGRSGHPGKHACLLAILLSEEFAVIRGNRVWHADAVLAEFRHPDEFRPEFLAAAKSWTMQAQRTGLHAVLHLENPVFARGNKLEFGCFHAP